MSSFAIVYDTFLSIEVIWERAIISGLYGTAVVGLTLKLFFVYDGKNDFPKYHKIKDVYKDAFLNLSYNQYDRALVSERLYSKWLLIKWWRDKRFYGL